MIRAVISPAISSRPVRPAVTPLFRPATTPTPVMVAATASRTTSRLPLFAARRQTSATWMISAMVQDSAIRTRWSSSSWSAEVLSVLATRWITAMVSPHRVMTDCSSAMSATLRPATVIPRRPATVRCRIVRSTRSSQTPRYAVRKPVTATTPRPVPVALLPVRPTRSSRRLPSAIPPTSSDAMARSAGPMLSADWFASTVTAPVPPVTGPSTTTAG